MFVQSNGIEEVRSTTYFNRPEAAEIYLLLQRLADDGMELDRIGVICMYEAQSILVKEFIENSSILRKVEGKPDRDFGKVLI